MFEREVDVSEGKPKWCAIANSWDVWEVSYSPLVDLIQISRRLRKSVNTLTFSPPVEVVYNPLDYARAAHEQFLERFGEKPGRIVLVGMNPGPWGMAQTGVPFGEVASVRDWMKIDAPIGKPKHEHPKRLVEGFACTRAEVSGARLWGWARERYRTPRSFFSRFFVLNYCPLSFMEESGRNRTPDKLPSEERKPLFDLCDAALLESFTVLQPKMIVGIGAFAMKMSQRILGDRDIPVGSILHPSPASPKANRGWAEAAEADFARLGIEL